MPLELARQSFKTSDVLGQLGLAELKIRTVRGEAVGHIAVLQRGLPHHGKYEIEVVFKQMLNQTAVNRRTEITATNACPLQCEVANIDGVRLIEFADFDNCLPTRVEMTARSRPPREQFLGTCDGSF